MRKLQNLKLFVLLACLMLPAAWCNANDTFSEDGYSHITINEGIIQGVPKGSSIQASISGHYLTVVFTENLGQVIVKITTVLGSTVDYVSMTTPNGYQYYIAPPGDYIVTFTLPNGDVYYGEFTVTD